MNNGDDLIIRGLTEQELLALIPASDSVYEHVIHGIGDDCAVIDTGNPGKDLLLTQDSLISGRHFLPHDDPYFIGWKALARSISDIAAMGGEPTSALVAYGIPSDTPVTWLEQVLRGIDACAKKYRCPLVGGDMASTATELFFSVTCTGHVAKSKAFLRSGAHAGDLLCVTGSLGGSMAGKHLCFEPRIDEAIWLRDCCRVSAMIDLSDGIGKDLFHIARSSTAGFVVYAESIPLSGQIQRDHGDDVRTAVSHALYDGEDYELLFTVSETEKTMKQVCAAFTDKFGIACTVIGECTSTDSVELYENGKSYTRLKPGGFEHFM